MIDDLTYHYAQGDAKTILINCHYPIDSNSFVTGNTASSSRSRTTARR